MLQRQRISHLLRPFCTGTPLLQGVQLHVACCMLFFGVGVPHLSVTKANLVNAICNLKEEELLVIKVQAIKVHWPRPNR